ncbi:MAG: polysaccharide biosynthesis protein PslG, partial [Thermoleophilaceae bacterium]|nr:polysaccharide biosynthesis protein PslG [Thermoleophilaceae bacterium]
WGSKMAALEVWNEPNLPNSLNSVAPAADYARILKAAYPRVKLAAPLLPVLGPAMAFSDGDFLEQLYAQGIQGSFDGLSFHPYNEWRAPTDPWQTEWRKYSYRTGVEWIHDILAAHGDGLKKLWFTELGWSSCLPGSDRWCVTGNQQAQFIPDSLRIIRDRWDFVDAAVIYNLRDKGTTLTDRESSFGMVKRDFTPKPSWLAFKSVVAELGGARPVPINAGPTVALTSPVPLGSFTSNACMAAQARDDSDVTKVEFRFDGKLVATDTSAPYSYSWTAPKTTTYKTHSLAATAYDAAGLSASSSTTVVRIKAGPSCQFASTASLRKASKRAKRRAHHRRRRP